jgi:hypothetical protein
LEELEAIYKNYYGNETAGNSYFKDTGILREKNSAIPVLKEHALFFNCYDDSVYESVLDDLKQEYARMMKDRSAW